MKIALIGVGSFVFGPSALNDAILEHALPDLHLALVDRDATMAELMAGVGRRMARDANRGVRITTHTDWADALEGCYAVVFSAAAQLQKRFEMDVEIIRRHYPQHVITEFGGVAGISYSLRQIVLITQLAADMRRLCPDAWLLNSSNPLPRVCEAAYQSGIERTLGFCNNAMKGYADVGRLLHGWNETFPWPQARQKYEAVMVGVNHLALLIALRDRSTGEDVLPRFIAAVRQDPKLGPITRRLLDQTGYLTTNGDDHIRDFLRPDASTPSIDHSSHGTAAEREHRLQLLRGVGDGSLPVSAVLAHRAWEKPIDVIAAIALKQSLELHSLNHCIEGVTPDLPYGAYVETPIRIIDGQFRPDTIRLPDGVIQVSRDTAELNQAIVEAAIRRDVSLLRIAVESDPTILDPAAGWAATQACMAAHADLIGTW